MTNNFLAFWLGYCIYIGATSSLSPLSLPTEIAAIKIKEDITPQKMIKKGSKEDITDFLQISNKLSSKKRRQINKSKQKASIREISSRKAIISNLESSNKKELLIFILVIKTSELKAINIDIAMISANAYCIACRLKKA